MIKKDQLQSERLVAPVTRAREDVQDRAIRPKALVDYIGQPAVREQMEIFIAAATKRAEALDHTLVFGPDKKNQTATFGNLLNELLGPQQSTDCFADINDMD